MFFVKINFLFIIGWFSIVISILELALTFSSIVMFYLGGEPEPVYPYKEIIYISMVSIVTLFNVCLVLLGLKFIQLKTNAKAYFFMLIFAEFCYFLIISTVPFLLNEPIANSIVSAIGIANVGLMIQVVTLFPLWATILLILHKPAR